MSDQRCRDCTHIIPPGAKRQTSFTGSALCLTCVEHRERKARLDGMMDRFGTPDEEMRMMEHQ